MRFVRFALVVPIALGALALMASSASALIPTQLSIPADVTLGPLGASVSVPLTVTCARKLNIAFGDASVIEATGHKLVQGIGSFANNPPGVPCTGKSETITMQVSVSGDLPFKKGNKAIASADLTIFNPKTGTLTTTSIANQAITISK